MYKNYFFLNRIIIDANNQLVGYSIENIFSQEKGKIIFELKNKSDFKFLEICVNPGTPYFTLKQNFHRAKKNTIDFFQKYLPAEILQFEICDRDRIIKIKTAKCEFYFAVRGKNTNLFAFKEDKLAESFKNIVDDSVGDIAEEFHSNNFTNHFNDIKIEIDREKDFQSQIKYNYPFVGKEILNELKFRSLLSENNLIFKSNLEKIILEIITAKPAVFIDEIQNEEKLAFENFNGINFTKKEIFDDTFKALNYYLSKEYFFNFLNDSKKKIEKHISRELEKLSSKLNNIKGRIEQGSKEEEYKKIGNLLLINLHQIKNGMNEIIVDDIYENNIPLKIKLDEKFSAKRNADIYFDTSKNQKISFEKSKQLFESLALKFNELKKIENKFLASDDLDNYKGIMKELKIKDYERSTSKDDIQSKFKKYLIENKYYVFVGKDSRNNDLLTSKFAKQNDYWFHARSVPGSHVVLRVDNNKEAVPKNILKKTASLAAYHSKAKTAGMVPVSFSLKKYVVKKKGMEAGKVALLREDVLIVKPEIPIGCEYISNE